VCLLVDLVEQVGEGFLSKLLRGRSLPEETALAGKGSMPADTTARNVPFARASMWPRLDDRLLTVTTVAAARSIYVPMTHRA